ncbi:sensor histidine kinase [Caulobacter sp. FWC2]|uniref:sensor histidine kinase n=1 Tax=Caulobacter sp. FWC2 TaxID=69664 RepID=UPI000C160079|nr:HWE histidine kinase domain-containing protein [Caulobacter sp. FWC2]PIB91924.1 histidine kinase [Caulobacter sp. FWC2]
MALTLAAPAILLMGALVAMQYSEGQRRFATQLTAMTRALSLATDRQIGQGQSILQGLSVSPALAEGDLKTFEKQAREATKGRDAWVVLMSQDRQWLNTRMGPGESPPVISLSDADWDRMSHGRTTVSDLIERPAPLPPIIGFDMPVLVEGKIFVLGYIQSPDNFHSLMTAQAFPETWTASIVDRKAALVARSRDQQKMLGRYASGDMQQAMARANEGVIHSQTLDGVKTLSAFSRSQKSGWTFIVGVPRDELNRTVLTSLGPAVAGAALLIALAVAAALGFARPISRDVRGLVGEAEALAAGAPLDPAPSHLQEIAEVRGSLQAAADILRARDDEARRAAERQQLMINELNHRVKNTLVVVQSLARHSLRPVADQGDLEHGLNQFNDRLYTLASAHDLLTRRNWEGADLGELLAEALKPYASQVSLDGPSVPLAPNAAVALAMIFHELATNASKYGALSTDSGKVAVSWSLGGRTLLTIEWRERGGPAVKPPERGGFGSRLIAASLKGDLAGSATFDYAPEGLTCVMSIIAPPQVSLAKGAV